MLDLDLEDFGVYDPEIGYFINHYTHCGTEWEDVWSSKCNDRCPVCNAEIEPYASDDITF